MTNLENTEAQAEAPVFRPLDLERQVLVFEFGNRVLAMRLRDVQEVLEIQPLVFIPGRHRAVRGAFNCRGQIYTVLNLGYLMEIPVTQEHDSRGRLLILRDADYLLAIELTRILEVTPLVEEGFPFPVIGVKDLVNLFSKLLQSR